jgi:hypothetical protein
MKFKIEVRDLPMKGKRSSHCVIVNGAVLFRGPHSQCEMLAETLEIILVVSGTKQGIEVETTVS